MQLSLFSLCFMYGATSGMIPFTNMFTQHSTVQDYHVLLLFCFRFSPPGVPRCVKTFTQHAAPIVAVKAGERFIAMASADNGLSLFHRPSSSLPSDGSRYGGAHAQGAQGTPNGPHAPRSPLTGGSLGMSDWQFYRHMNRAPELVSADT